MSPSQSAAYASAQASVEASAAALAEVAFSVWFGISRREATVLGVLFRAKGSAVDRCSLASSVGSTPSTISVAIHHLRRSMDGEAIDQEPGQGYRLTESGRSECLAVLWKLGEEMRSAA